MSEQGNVDSRLSDIQTDVAAVGERSSTPTLDGHVDATEPTWVVSNSDKPLHCSVCFDEDTDVNEKATKICHTCDGRAFCDICFTFLHRTRKQKEHTVQYIDPAIYSGGNRLEAVGGAPEDVRVTDSSKLRPTPLNAKDSDLQQTLARTGKPILQHEPGLFQFMRVVEDEGDSRMVDKVINVQEEILRFCKVMKGDSCSLANPSAIDFQLLDDQKVTVTGIYGETLQLLRFLDENLHMSPESVSLLATSTSDVSPGVYAFVSNRESLFLFYWSRDITYNNYASSGVSCQCIRYLQRLCHSIVVLFDTTSLDSLHLTRVRRQEQASYADMKVSKVEDCEETVTVHPGFTAEAHCLSSSQTLEQWKGTVFSSGREGFIVCTPRTVPQTKDFAKREHYHMSKTYYKNTFSQQVQQFHVDCSAIVDDDRQIKSFLLLTFPQYHKAWCEKEKRLQSINSELDSELVQTKTAVMDERLRLCKIWREGVAHFFSILSPDEEHAIGTMQSSCKPGIEGTVLEEPLLAEAFKQMPSKITDAVANLRKKAALMEVLCEMEQKAVPDYSLANNLTGDLFPLDVSYEDVLSKLTNPHIFRRLYNYIKGQGIKRADLEIKVRAKMDANRLPTQGLVFDRFKEAYKLKLRRYYMSHERANIPLVDEMIRVRTEELTSKKREEQVHSALASFRQELRQSGLNQFESSFKFRVKSFKLSGNKVIVSYEEEILAKEEVGYDVYQLRIKQNNVAQMQKEALVSIRSSLQWIDGAYLHLKKDNEELRGLYCLQKSRQALALVYNKDETRLLVYVGDWKSLTKRPLRSFPRDCDAHAFDAERRVLALSNSSEQRIALFQLTECYSQLIKYTCGEISLSGLCPPSFVVKQLQIIEGQDELLMVGSTSQGYVYDMKRCRLQNTDYSFDREVKKVFTIPGYVLEVAGGHRDETHHSEKFLLGVHSTRSRKLLTTIPLLNVTPQNVEFIQLLDLGSQVHLCIPMSDGHVTSFLVQSTAPASHLQFKSKRARPAKIELMDVQEGNALLECFYRIFYKYPIRDCYETVVSPLALFCVHREAKLGLEGKVRSYMEDLLEELEEETGKTTRLLLEKMEIVGCTVEDCSKLMWKDFTPTRGGQWIRKLISAVPIQIARPEGDRLLPLSKGMNLNLDWSCADMADVINAISFGLYEALFKAADVPVKVLSAKGRQSVGKSYLLNHVAGAQFDIEGGRCTHGVWMTAKVLPDMLLVVLDFEGLGSFERTRQEDVLLAVFGAAVSNLTVFKTDCRFDRDTEAMFDRLQDGAKLLKSGQRNKLFKGKLAIVVRDVSKTASDATIEHFLSKIEQVCQAHSASNFVCNLYSGEYRVATSQPMGNSQFLQSFEKVKEDLNKQSSTYVSPIELMGVLKTLLAKIYLQDWSPIDRTRVVQKVSLLERNLSDAAMFGALAYPAAGIGGYEFQPLSRLGSTNPELIPDGWDGDYSKALGNDTGIQLLSAQDEADVTQLRESMIAKFSVSWEAQDFEVGAQDWVKRLAGFFSAIACRRIQRVQVWIHKNTEGYTDDEEVQQLLRKADTDYFRSLREVWSVCGEKCNICYRLCVRPKYHKQVTDDDEQHTCGTKHTCPKYCSFCEDEVVCGYVALHTGEHHCKLQSHTCGETCSLFDRPGCNELCSLPSDHQQKTPSSKHKCDADTHYCGKECDLVTCRKICYYPCDVSHDRHRCNTSSGCPFRCVMKGCSVVCSSTNHFHSIDRKDEHHFCGNAHPCPSQCGQDGLCGIDVQLVSVRPSKVLTQFQGRRGVYEYQLFSQQVKVKKPCGKLIPQGSFCHEGPHVHAAPRGESLPEHFCDQQCTGCLRYCEKEYGHSGRHVTTHGNMSRQIFVSSEKSFYVGEREFERGESAITELCDQFCKRLGRGHTHVIVCKKPSTCTQPKHNKRILVTEGYNDLILDEVTHDAYWEEIDFEDPCTSTEQGNFRKCNVVCERATVAGAVPSPEDYRSPYYCQLPLWHKPLALGTKVECGHLSVKGHHFHCTHELKYQYHAVLIIDQSGSMHKSDDTPQHQLLLQNEHLNNRLGAVLEACHTFVDSRFKCSDGDRFSLITFSRKANTVLSGDKVSNGLLFSLVEMNLKPEGNTYFAPALEAAKSVINEVAKRHPSLSPLVIMLSDGLAHDHDKAVREAKRLVSGCPKAKDRPIIHTIKFGHNTSGNNCLQELANIGKGEMHLARDKFELADQFREFNELMTQGIVGTIRNIPPSETGLLDKEGESWFPQEALSAEREQSVSLQILENGNDLYQICGARHISDKSYQNSRIRPINLNHSGTIGDALSVVFSIRHMGQMYRLKCLFRQKMIKEGEEVILKSNEVGCLKQLGIHRNVESVRHSFEDRADISFPWLDDECRSRSAACGRASFVVVDCYDQTLREFAQNRRAGDHPLREAFGIRPKDLVMILLQLCDALRYLARKDIIHGCISEDNICLRTPAVPVLCNFESSFSIRNIAAVRKALSAKHCKLGVTCDAPPELAVKPAVLAKDPNMKEVDCIIQQVIKMDMFGLGVMMYNLLLPERSPKFPTVRPYVEDRLPVLWERVNIGFRQLLFNMVRRDPELRISVKDGLLACQLLLSDLDVDRDAVTETKCAEWLREKKKAYLVDETLESELIKEFLDTANSKEIFRVRAKMKVRN